MKKVVKITDNATRNLLLIASSTISTPVMDDIRHEPTTVIITKLHILGLQIMFTYITGHITAINSM